MKEFTGENTELPGPLPRPMQGACAKVVQVLENLPQTELKQVETEQIGGCSVEAVV